MLVSIFLLFLSLTRSAFCFGSRSDNEFFPTHPRTAFCHLLLSKSLSYSEPHSVFGEQTVNPSYLQEGRTAQRGPCLYSHCSWSWRLPLALQAASCSPVTLQMQAAVILGTLVICVIYLVPLRILWSPE